MNIITEKLNNMYKNNKKEYQIVKCIRCGRIFKFKTRSKQNYVCNSCMLLEGNN